MSKCGWSQQPPQNKFVTKHIYLLEYPKISDISHVEGKIKHSWLLLSPYVIDEVDIPLFAATVLQLYQLTHQLTRSTNLGVYISECMHLANLIRYLLSQWCGHTMIARIRQNVSIPQPTSAILW